MLSQQVLMLKKEDLSERIKHLPNNSEKINKMYSTYNRKKQKVIIVLDDDPTGIQTIHDVNVYMDWSHEVLFEIFAKEDIVFIQTNSRSLTKQQTKDVHEEIMNNIVNASKKYNRDFTIISRGDSTLRGHYPLETMVIKEAYEKLTNKKIDAEILIPLFFESGRVTYKDIHFIQEGEYFIPTNQTEFSKDAVFGYKNANLKNYIEEKTEGKYCSDDVVSIPLELLRNLEIEKITLILTNLKDFHKVIVNALTYDDLKVFCIALIRAEEMGKIFLYRTAASFVKTYGFIKDKSYLKKEDIDQIAKVTKGQILIIVGSYVNKTTQQLKRLLECKKIHPIEINVKNILKNETEKEREVKSIVMAVERAMKDKKNPVIYTSRELVKDHSEDHSENNLIISKTISDTLSEIVSSIETKPFCIISKGGITSSDIATKALGIRKGKVLGQILSSVPVIISKKSKKWSNIPFVIFPGNVGDNNSLKDVYHILESKN
ncbi:hydroxyacid dehydrogenase [Bacillaceae bacterium Marseille-Q3522]|nr:hydroxyacid dehydrogenase [Bacillaceae bacterium Marseille-Q3522]